jgi:hypothetical protein
LIFWLLVVVAEVPQDIQAAVAQVVFCKVQIFQLTEQI